MTDNVAGDDNAYNEIAVENVPARGVRFGKYLLGGFLVALVSGASALVYNMPEKSVTFDAGVEILVSDGLGSGVSIGNGMIVTAAHVVRGQKDVTVEAQDGKKYTARVLWSSDASDVAMLSVKDAKLPAAKLFCGDVRVGDEISAIGNPLGVKFVTSYGHVAAKAQKVGDIDEVFPMDMTTVMGQSGGPVFSNGRVVGIISMVMSAPLKNGDSYTPSLVGFGFAVPSSVVCDLLARGGE